jgi:histidinol dehydrogenase
LRCFPSNHPRLLQKNMTIYRFPTPDTWAQLLQRPALQRDDLRQTVQQILHDIRLHGDDALRQYATQFDRLPLDAPIEVAAEDFTAATMRLPEALKTAIQTAKDNLTRFHERQVSTSVERIETMSGVTCWRKSVGIERVGLYIPGGTAPLFSTVLMLGVPAQLAACSEVLLCTPPQANGKVHDAVLFAAQLVGIRRVFAVGGVQAIGAMAYGTATIPRVFKIFGPGNQYVTAAKQMVNMEGIAIDMPAGPSEVMVLADATAQADFIAADLLSQAEHGADSQVVFVTTHEPLLAAVQAALQQQLQTLPRADFAQKALDNSVAILVKDLKEALAVANVYAAEHLILSVENAEYWGEQVVNAGSVFLGHYSPESVGDYASGTNHTLPTNGFAQAYSGVSVDSFVKKITFQQLTINGLRGIADTVTTMARAENLEAHARAVTVRL